jgi:hypothetical protein
MYIAKDAHGSRNIYLTVYEGRSVWGDDRALAQQFDTAEEAVTAGKEAMPSGMEDRVVSERA